MGTQADYWTDVYATTHEQRLAQSMQFAREELVAKYGAAETYAKYQQDLLKMYEEELGKAQRALLEYDEKRGGKQGSIDDTAKLLGVMADAGNTVARETGEAAQRKLEAAAGVQSRYRMTSGQSSAVGSAGDKIATTVDATYRVPGDIDRAVTTALGSIPDGTFPAGTDASKTGAAELFTRMDAELRRRSPSVYGADPTAPDRLKDAIATKLGVDAKYTNRAEVKSDEDIAIAQEQRTVGVTGTGTSAQAAKMAKELIEGKVERLTDEQKKDFAAFQENYGGKYFDLLKEGATIGEAKAAIKADLDRDKAAEFEASFEKARTALAEGGDQDLQKFFDPAYVGAYSRAVKLGSITDTARADFAGAVQALRSPPTEEAARRRGAEIYEPISPGVGRRTREATSRLEERAATSRMTGVPMSDEDLMASRILERAPQLPDDQRILAGASAGAIRALDEGWTPDKFKSGKAGDFDGKMSVEDFEALGMGPATSIGYRLYSNVKEKQLRDVSPKGLVQYASDLAGGDLGLRDAVLQEYYKFAGYDMRGTKVMKAKEDVQKAETPEVTSIPGIGKIPQVDIKSEDIQF